MNLFFQKKIVIVGGTGNVGKIFFEILLGMNVKATNLAALASEKSIGSFIHYGDEKIPVEEIHSFDFSSFDFAFFAAGTSVSAKYAKIAEKAGAIVIDNTSYFRMMEKIPLIVPEVNLKHFYNSQSRIIANPNCSTIQMVIPLKPLHDEFIIKKIIVSTYQSVSGGGQKLVEKMQNETQLVLKNFGTTDENKDENKKQKNINKIIQITKQQNAFNLVPQIDIFMDDFFTKEEWKMKVETNKILSSNIQIVATCVRVPVFVSHSESIYVEFEKNISVRESIEILENTKGVVVGANDNFHTPVECAGKDEVFVSRIRQEKLLKNSLSFWCVADNLRRGAALNAIKTAEAISNSKIK